MLLNSVISSNIIANRIVLLQLNRTSGSPLLHLEVPPKRHQKQNQYSDFLHWYYPIQLQNEFSFNQDSCLFLQPPAIIQINIGSPPNKIIDSLASNKIYNKMLNFIDFRNAAYQGQTQDGKPHGLGIVIDSNQLFCLAQWSFGKIDGPVFAVFPDYNVFCGRIRNNRLEGLCCFYLQDRMQTFVNYTEKAQQTNNLIAVLPFCKLIMEIDHSEEDHPKVKRYQNYNEAEVSYNQQLTRMFGKYYGLDEYKRWQDFLLINFIAPFQHKLVWRVIPAQRYNEYFIGIKSDGMGIKMLVFRDDEDAHNFQASPLIVSSIGKYSSEEELKGYGQKLVDYQYYRKLEEGIFSTNQIETCQFHRNNRPATAVKTFQQNLLKSVYFQNTFINISYLYKLQTIYSKIKVSLVQQTHKIALVTMEKANSTSIELAQIENKRQRRRNGTPNNKSKYSNHGNSGSKSKQKQPRYNRGQYSFNNKRQGNPENRDASSIQNSSVQLGEARKSIFGSVQKIKKNDPQKRTQAIQKFQKVFFEHQNSYHESQTIKTLKKTRLSNINLSPLPKNGIYQERSKYDYQTLGSNKGNYQNQREIFDQNRYRNKDNTQNLFLAKNTKKTSFTPTKYQRLHADIAEFNPNLNYARDGSQYIRASQQNLRERHYMPPENYPLKRFAPETRLITPQRRKVTPQTRQITPDKGKIYQRAQSSFNMSKDSDQPLYKTIMEDEVYSRYYQKIQQKQQQLKYFNSFMDHQRPTEKKLPEMRDMHERSYQNVSLGVNKPARNKTPGKIKIVNRKKPYQQQY